MAEAAGRTVRSSFVLLAGSLSRGGAQGIAALIVANAIGASEWGLVATVQVGVLLVVQLSSSGSYVAQLGRSQPGQPVRATQPPSQIELALLVCFALFASISLPQLFLDLTSQQVLLCGALGVTMILGSILEQVTKADLILVDAIARVSAVNATRSIVVLVAAVVFVLSSSPGDGNGWLLCLIASWVTHTFLLLALRRNLGLPFLSNRRTGTVANLIALGSFGVSIAATAALRTTDQLLVADIAGLEEAGTYAIAARIVDMGVLVIGARAQVSHRMLAEQPSMRKLVTTAYAVAARLAIVAGAMTVVAVVAAIMLSRLLDDSFAEVGSMGIILAISLIARGMFLAIVFALMLGGQTWERISAIVIALALNIGLNLAFIPRWGGQGAAVSTVIAEFVLVGLMALMLNRMSRNEAST